MHPYVTTAALVCAVALHFSMSNQYCYCRDLDPLPKPRTIVKFGPSDVYPSNAGNLVAVIPDSQRVTPHLRGVASGELLHIKDWPPDRRVRHVAFSRDDSKMLLVCADDSSAFSVLCVDTVTGTVDRFVSLPESIVSCTAVRYSENCAYLGGQTLLRMDEKSTVVTTVDVRNVSYIFDVAIFKNSVSFVDFFGMHFIGRFGGMRQHPLSIPAGPLRQMPYFSVDISRDGKAVIAASSASVSSTMFSSAVVTYEMATGKPLSSVLVPGVAKHVRFIGDSYAYVVLEMMEKDHGATRVHVYSEDHILGSWQGSGDREHIQLLSVTSDSGDNGHLSVGTNDGTVVQWRRKDLSAGLARKLFDRDR